MLPRKLTEATAAPHVNSHAGVSRPYALWVLAITTLIYAFSFMDRVLMSIAAPALKAEMHLTDGQLGLLIGLAFALFYTILGIPIARLAERFSRVVIISLTIVLWSVMTIGCGTATTYAGLSAFRLGVGIGEAGSAPAAYSLLADYFSGKRRSLIFAVYAAGVPIGVLMASFIGAPLIRNYGWQHAFFYVGIPGVLVGALAYLTVKEPVRGNSAASESGVGVPPLTEVIRRMLSNVASRHMLFAVMLGMFAMSAIFLFLPLYFVRVYGMNFGQAGLAFGIIGGAGGLTGNLLSGYLSDRLGKRNAAWNGYIPALGCVAAAVLAGISFLQPVAATGVALLVGFAVGMNFWNGPAFAVILSLLEPRMRATASALTLSAMALVGQGLGPGYLGFLSDFFARRIFDRPDFSHLCVVAGHGASAGVHAAADVPANIAALCTSASASGLQYALLSATPILLWAAIHYGLAGRKYASLKDAERQYSLQTSPSA
ncbi:spinster family MFS transporter [Paraburkholderia kururiensis]|uniref:spinster family MFS transporter n=1 Tax=Paraburkholderia kururiensis TaxID=984307 RepID=UPI00034A1B2A|nr:MFS transporter [Paraburkholderia kururiensis]